VGCGRRRTAGECARGAHARRGSALCAASPGCPEHATHAGPRKGTRGAVRRRMTAGRARWCDAALNARSRTSAERLQNFVSRVAVERVAVGLRRGGERRRTVHHLAGQPPSSTPTLHAQQQVCDHICARLGAGPALYEERWCLWLGEEHPGSTAAEAGSNHVEDGIEGFEHRQM
jgi:hypothetical protein